MKTRILTVGFAGALAFSAFGTALADSPNWDAEKAEQIAINRCTNAGGGNGGEFVSRRGLCLPTFRDSEDAPRDMDPGNSGG